MTTQNIAIPTGESSAQLLNLATHIFEAHGPEIGDAVINKNFVLAWLKEKAKEQVVGGLDFAEPVLIGENSNFSHRSHYSQIDANIQDPTREFRFDPVTLSGTIVINRKHEAMNSGKAAIKKLMTTLKLQADSTISNTVNTAMWNTSPTANVEPESIPSLLSITPTTGTIGGISRSGNAYAQNAHSDTTISSIGSAAGVGSLHKFRANLGGSSKVVPDFAVTTSTLWGNLYGYLDGLRRLRANEKMTALELDNFYVGSELVGYDGDGGSGECPDNYMYHLNSKHLFFKCLEGGDFKFEPFSYKDNSLNATSIFYLFYNLTTNLPSCMGVQSSITG